MRKGQKMIYSSEAARQRAVSNLKTDGTPTHGLSRKPIYISWSNMKARCDNPNNPSYKDYGQRGITYCIDWNSFENFYRDMGHTWSEGLTLERKNVNKSYSPKNCTWVNRYKQSINRTNTRMFKLNGQKMTITDWAKHLGKKRSTLAQRYYVLGWSIEDTLLR